MVADSRESPGTVHLPLPGDPRPERERARTAPALPLEALLESASGGWVVRLPVRAERVTVGKQVVVAEEVTVRRDQIEELVRVRGSVAREKLRVERSGDVEMISDPSAEDVTLRPAHHAAADPHSAAEEPPATGWGRPLPPP